MKKHPTMISTRPTNKMRQSGYRRLTLSLLALLYHCMLISSQVSFTQSHNESPGEPSKNAGTPCGKGWSNAGNKCYKIPHMSRNSAGAKAKCSELGAQLITIEDESLDKESESPNMINNIITYLTSELIRFEVQSKPYHVFLSSDLVKQFNESRQNGFYTDGSTVEAEDHLESEVALSKLWFPHDDPIHSNITSNSSIMHGDSSAFALAYSNYSKRWGILPVSPNRRMSFICEKNVPSSTPNKSQSQASVQYQSIEAKRGTDLVGQASTFNSDQTTTDTRRSSTIRTTEKEMMASTPLPESISALFREYPQDQSIILGSTVEMRCSPLESDAILHWTFNGKNLTLSNRVKSYPSGTIKIEHVRNTDDGNYTCTIHSGGLTESKWARLEIVEKPHQPEYITAELLDKVSTSVRIRWTPGFDGNSPIKMYTVEMRTVDKDNIENDISTIMQSKWEIAKANISADQTSVIIPDLKPARKYIFRITATNKVGTGDPSYPNKHPIEIPVQPPSMPPEKLSGVPKTSTSISIQWSPPPQESQNGVLKGYKIKHKLAGYASDSDFYTSDVTDASQLTFVLDDLIVWQNYEIQVAAENDKGVGPFSSSIFVRTKEGKPDRGPRDVSGEPVNPTVIKVDWNPPPPQHINGVNRGYKIELWYDALHTQLAKDLRVQHNTASPHNSAIIDGLLPYTDYHISVRCYTNAGDGPPNDDRVVVKTKQDVPEAVESLEFADILDKSLRIVWRPPKRINGELDRYVLEYFETSSPDRKISRTYPPSNNEVRITDLSPQTAYTFKLYAHTKIGPGPVKVNQTTTSVPPVLPEAPSSLVVTTINPHSVTIHFTPGSDGNANIEKWNVEALSPSRGDYAPRWTHIYTSTNHSQGDSVVVRNLRPFTRYKLRLTPVNVVGPSLRPSDPTDEFQTAQIEPEQPPRDLSIEDVKATSVVAHWTPLANNMWLGVPRGYNLTWSEASSSNVMFHLINDTRASSFFIKDLEEFTEYSFKIYSVNEAGLSPPSEVVVTTTLEDTPSSGPTNLTAHAISSNAVTLDWNPIPKRHRNGIIRGYKIQYQIVNSTQSIQYKTVDDNTTRHVTLNDLKAFTTYQLAVAGYTSLGDGVFSSSLTVQTFEDTPGAPQNLSFPTVSQTAARILWDPPEDPNGDILGYKVSYHTLSDGSKEVASQELHQNERTFKVNNLKADTHYVFTVTAKTKEGWGQQASMLLYTHDSELRANLPFYKESWFVILCACLSVVITIIITALLFVQTKSYKYKQDAIKSTSQDRLGDTGFSLDDDPNNHYNNGFGLLPNAAHHRRSNGALSQSTANFTLPKSPPRPHPSSVVYSDDGDDDVFEDIVDKHSRPGKSHARTSNNYEDSSGDSLTEKPSEISSSPAPDSESADDEYVNMASRNFVNHYANVNGTLRGQNAWKKNLNKVYSSSHRTKPKLPQRPAPSVPQVPGDPSSSGSDNVPVAGTSSSLYGESSGVSSKSSSQQTNQNSQTQHRNITPSSSNQYTDMSSSGEKSNLDGNMTNQNNQQPQQQDILNGHVVNLNGGRIIVDNMAGSRAPLPGFTSFV